MSDEHLRQHLALYGPGLEAEVALLHQLQRLALAQRDALDGQATDLLSRIAQERDRIMAALVTIEENLRTTRQELAANREAVAGMDGFAEIAQLHRTAADLVATIVHSDQDTQQALQEAEVARRFAADTLNVAGSTLAAYRRVVAPPVTGVGLVDRRG
ncbi:MAG: hypothetical protein NT151_02110 [Acidobacteria bacterium]|nr:hypothetical protein [Acidobacteriota bacterium]